MSGRPRWSRVKAISRTERICGTTKAIESVSAICRLVNPTAAIAVHARRIEPAAWSSSDGRTWARLAIADPGAGELLDVAAAPDAVVLVGAAGGSAYAQALELAGLAGHIDELGLQRSELVRFESLAAARAFFLRAKKEEVKELECWIFREGKTREVRIKT